MDSGKNHNGSFLLFWEMLGYCYITWFRSIAVLFKPLLYRHECFTGKYTTRKIHTKPHPGLEWHTFYILTSEHMISLISSLSLKLFLNSLVYQRYIFSSSTKVFSNLRKSLVIFGILLGNFGNAWQHWCDLWTSFGESLEIFWRWSQIFGKLSKTLSLVCLYNEKNITC